MLTVPGWTSSQQASQGVSEPACVAVQPEGGQPGAREDGASATCALPPAHGPVGMCLFSSFLPCSWRSLIKLP